MVKLTSALSLLFVVLLTGTVSAQSKRTQKDMISAKITEVQAMIDEELRTLATLQGQLNRAVDAKQEEQIDRLRDEILSAGGRVDKLNELKDSLRELLESAPARRRAGNRNPAPEYSGTGPGRVISDGDRDRNGLNRDDSSRSDKPRVSVARGSDQDEPVPGADQRPRAADRSGPAGFQPMDDPQGNAGRNKSKNGRINNNNNASNQDNNAPNNTDRLDTLRRWYDELIADGDQIMAGKVMELIRAEKQRSASSARDSGNRSKNRADRPRPAGGAGGNLPALPDQPTASDRDRDKKMRDDQNARQQEMQKLIESMNDELDALRDEVRKLRQQQKGDGSR